MTDSSDPKAQKSPRRRPGREPATLDLKATVIDDGGRRKSVHEAVQEAVQESIQQDDGPGDTIVPEADLTAQEAVATPQATLDSGAGTDSIGPVPQPEEAAQETPVQDEPPREPPGDEPVRPAPPPAPAERRTSPAALIGAGLLGGLVGAGLVYGLQIAQGPQGQDDQRLARLEQRVGALGQQNSGQQPANLQAVENRLKDLEAARASVDQRLQALQGTAGQAAAKAEEALNRPQPAPAAPPQTNEAALTDLANRLSALEGRVQTVGQDAAGAAQNASTAANAAQALDHRVSELESRLGEQQQAAAERDRRLAEQGQNLSALGHQVTEKSQGAETASQAGIRVILAERLGEALKNGTPYADVLDGLKKAGTDQNQLAPLEPFAQKGAPTAAALAESFKPLGATILRDERASSGNWGDRILRMMDRVVTVRPVNDAGSAGVSGLVARVEQALERGDVVAAAAAWEALPEPARRTSEEWGQQAKAVADAAKASQAISASALAALNQTAQ